MNILLLLLPSLIASASLDESSDAAFQRGLRERANAAEARPVFATAAEGYRQKWSHGHQRGVALAWGRASYLAGDLPSAIAAFRSGLRYFPADRELLSGLRHVRVEVATIGGITTSSEGLVQRYSPFHRIVWAGVSMSMFAIGLWCRFTTRWRSANWWITIGFIGLAASAVLNWQCQRETAADLAQPAYVLQFDTPLRTGNGETYAPRLPALLPLGTEVREVARRGGWVQIQLESGELGWVPEEALLKVE